MPSFSPARVRMFAAAIVMSLILVLPVPARTELGGQVTVSGEGSTLLLSPTFIPTEYEQPGENSWIFHQREGLQRTSISVLHLFGDPTSVLGVCVESFRYSNGSKLWCANDPFDVPGVEIQGTTVTFAELTVPQVFPDGENQSLVIDGVLERPEVVPTESHSVGTVKSWFVR